MVATRQTDGCAPSAVEYRPVCMSGRNSSRRGSSSRAFTGGGRSALVLGVPIDDVTMDEAVACVFDLVDDGHRTGRCHQVATVNVDFVINSLTDPHLVEVLLATALSIPDGMPLVWGSRLLKSPLRTRVAGADLLPRLVEHAADEDVRILLYGGAPGVAPRAAARLRAQHPGADVVGAEAPRFDSVDDIGSPALELIKEAAPDILCVAFGNPKQERFISRYARELGIPVSIGVGGSLDFIVGAQRRAPGWMQRSGLEWLYRAGTEPRRLARRYLRDVVVYIPALLRQAWGGRSSTRQGAYSVSRNNGEVLIDAKRVEVIDNQMASELTGIIRRAHRSGWTVSVEPPPWHSRRSPDDPDSIDLARMLSDLQRRRWTRPGHRP